MKKLLLIIFVFSFFSGCSSEAPRAEQELVDLYVKYHNEKNLEGMMSLFYQEDTPDFILESHRKTIERSFELTITDVKVERMLNDDIYKVMNEGYEYQGNTIVVNMEPIKRLVIAYDTSHDENLTEMGHVIMFGKIDRTHYFVLAKFK